MRLRRLIQGGKTPETDLSKKKRFTNRRPIQINAPKWLKNTPGIIRIYPNNDPVLKVDCEFVGEEIKFQDLWYDHQD